MDAWLSKDVFPFPLLGCFLELFCNSGVTTRTTDQLMSLFYKRVAPALLRLAIFLLLAPARTTISQESTEYIRTFVLNLHHLLDRERQAELVHSLLHLSEETAMGDWGNATTPGTEERSGRKQTPPVTYSMDERRIHQIVNKVLQRLAESSPKSLIRFKHVLTKRLTSTICTARSGGDESVREFCSILTSLVVSDGTSGGGDGLESSELMMLLQKLLFSSSTTFEPTYGGAFKGDSTRIVRGIWLATELVRCSSISARDKNCIKEWVLRLLLPATRRMVDPELGIPGLSFLHACMSHVNGSKNSPKDVFRYFKMILANTGLIQMLSSYKKGKKHDAILGYTKLAVECQSHTTAARKTRDMIFCVNYFLRYNAMDDPGRWQYATQWAFSLVDEYLRMGREQTANWQPHGWLVAAVEFPTISFSSDTCAKNHRAIDDWIDRTLCRFDLSRGGQQVHSMPAALCDFVACLEVRQLRLFQSSVFRFALSLLIGITLSAATLKNAFEHVRSIQNESGESEYESNDILRSIKFQLKKIYDLRTKTDAMNVLLSSMELALRRMLPEEQSAIDDSSDLTEQPGTDKQDASREVRSCIVPL